MPEKPEAPIPWPKSEAELLAYVREMLAWPNGAVDGDEGYGRCVYAVANAAVATFNYMAHQIGITGFQASCADMQILSETRGMKHGFLIVDGENLLYPQYDKLADVKRWIAETRKNLAPEAAKRLAEDGGRAHARVRRHWASIAALGNGAAR